MESSPAEQVSHTSIRSLWYNRLYLSNLPVAEDLLQNIYSRQLHRDIYFDSLFPGDSSFILGSLQ